MKIKKGDIVYIKKSNLFTILHNLKTDVGYEVIEVVELSNNTTYLSIVNYIGKYKERINLPIENFITKAEYRNSIIKKILK